MEDEKAVIGTKTDNGIGEEIEEGKEREGETISTEMESEIIKTSDENISENITKIDEDISAGYDGGAEEEEESDDGVKEGDRIEYVGEIDPDAPSNYTNPQRRKIFKKERKIREKEIVEMEQEIEVKCRQSRERKRERRAAKRRTMEEELFNDSDQRMEEKLQEYSRQKRYRLMKRFMSEESEYRDYSEYGRSYHRSRSMDEYRWSRRHFMGAFRHQMWEQLEMMDYHRRDDRLSPSDKRRMIERQVMMIMEDDSSSETSDNSDIESLQMKIFSNKCLNMKCEDMMHFTTMRDMFSKKVLLGDTYTMVRYTELHPELLQDKRFLSAMVYQASTNRSLSCLRFLLNSGGRTSRPSPYPDDNGKTPLHVACEKNLNDIVQTLVNRKALTEKRDKDGNTPLLTALHNGANEVIIESLLSRMKLKLMEHINNKGQGLLTCHGPWYTDRSRSEFKDNSKAITVLLKKAKELGELDSLLHYRCLATNLPPLLEAMNARNTDNMKVMIDFGANVNDRLNDELYHGQTLCHFSATKRFSGGMQMLLDGGAAPDARDSKGHSVLQYLFRPYFESNTHDYEMFLCLNLLAENGANINAPLNESYDTSLHVVTQLALRTGLTSFAINLVRSGGNPLAENKYKVTPLMIAKHGGNEMLLTAMENVACCVKSLSECCKWVIAQSMGQYGPIKHTAKLLPLPKHLIEYIMKREERRDSFFGEANEST